jgi:phosphotransferase system enzyme I (PtsI)
LFGWQAGNHHARVAVVTENGEQMFRGIGVSPGVVRGRIVVLDPLHGECPEQRHVAPTDHAAEIDRLQTALAETRRQISNIQGQVQQVMGFSESAIFDAHLLVLEDQTLLDEVKGFVETENVNVDFAFHEVAEKYLDALGSVDDALLRERVADIRDVTTRVLANLTGRAEQDLSHLTEPYILIGHDLSPSETAKLNRDLVQGFATDAGGKTSHTAIMAGSLRIPAVVGLKTACKRMTTGDYVLLDGFNGVVVVNPSDQTLFEYGQLEKEQEDLQAKLTEIRDSPAITLDGREIILSANVEQISDTLAVLESGAAGVGLFRTEYLFLDREILPDEEEQFTSYQRVAQAIAPESVIFRTLDIGADKMGRSLGEPEEANPFLGWRAIRFCLARKDIFRAQLRALLRASAGGNVKIMYPMISGVEELDEANELLAECQGELRAEGKAFDEELEVGVMIEIPSAVLIADALGTRAKFFSIGTNDLVQYTLAVDRLNAKVADLYDPTHPAMLRLLKMTIEAGQRHGIWTGLCGEMAGDPTAIPLLIGLGVDELSVSPPMLPQIKYLIRRLKLSETQQLAARALECDSSVDILVQSRAMVQRAAPGIFHTVL